MQDANHIILEEKKKRLDDLIQEYKNGSAQLGRELDDTHRLRLANRLASLENQIQKLDKEIQDANSELGASYELDLNDIAAIRIHQNHIISESFPFTNRIDELENFKSSFAPPYILLDAPAGFGKTHLLIELGKHFAERNWVVVYARVRASTTPEDLAKNISTALFVHAYYDNVLSSSDSPGEAFGKSLYHYWRTASQKDNPFKGLILLLDSADGNTESLFHKLYSSFIPDTEAILRILRFFTDGRRFRVMLGGRYLARPLSSTALISGVRHLSPFTFKVVHDALNNFLKDHNLEDNEQLAAHLFYLTGGHPGCYALCVKDFVNTPQEPNRYFERSLSRLWNDFVRPYTRWATEALADYAMIMEQLSLFRLCNNFVLKHIIAQLGIEQDPNDLADRLTGAFLLHRDGRFLKDNIIRRLLVIKMRYEEPDKFIRLSHTAQQVCFNQISQPKVQNPEMWVIEYLFLKVQEIAQLREINEDVTNNEDSFFEIEIPHILGSLVNDRAIPKSQWIEEKNVIIDDIKKDWEFQFMLKYAFRNPQFNENPYQKLLQSIGAFFKS